MDKIILELDDKEPVTYEEEEAAHAIREEIVHLLEVIEFIPNNHNISTQKEREILIGKLQLMDKKVKKLIDELSIVNPKEKLKFLEDLQSHLQRAILSLTKKERFVFYPCDAGEDLFKLRKERKNNG